MVGTIDQILQIGTGTANGHHGEIIQGVFEGQDKKLYRGLVTLPLKTTKSHARFLRDNSKKITIINAEKIKAKKAAELTGIYLTGDIVGGTLEIISNIPNGKGLGSSTTDVVSTIKAVAESLGRTLDNREIASLAVKAEEASDSIMFQEQVVLFAQRDGIVLRYFNGPLPPMHIIGFDTARNEEVDTLKMKLPKYSEQDITTFKMIIKLLARGIKEQDPLLIGRAATASAIINQKYLPKKFFDHILKISEKHSACGVQVAHSGTVAGIIFDIKSPNYLPNFANACNELKDLGLNCYDFFI